jgi:hypothetical protein
LTVPNVSACAGLAAHVAANIVPIATESPSARIKRFMLGSRLYVVYPERLMSGDPERTIAPGTKRPHDAAADDATMTGSEPPSYNSLGI